MRLRHLSLGAAVLGLGLGLGAGPALARPPSAPGRPVSQSCAASQLSLAVPAAIAGDPTAGMGKLAWNILLRNTGHAGCSLRGWPGLDVTAAGKPVAITGQDVSFSNLAAVSPRPVVLAAGQRAVVTVQASDATAGCRSPWRLTLRLPGGAGSLTASQPPRFFGPCGGGPLRLSPFYPLSALARAVAGLTVAHSPSPFHITKAPVPGACTPRRLRVSASYDLTGSGGSVTILRLVSSGPCVLPGEWPAITLHAADGATQIAKALPGLPRGVIRSPLTVYQQAHPVSTDVTLSRAAAASIALVTRTTGPGACHVAATATVYPGLSSTGAGLTVRLPRPVTFCGLPRVLSFLAGHPPAASLLAEARALSGGLSPYGDSPAGFWYGSDSNAPVPCCHNGRGVWLMPDSPKGGAYGGYVGEVGAYDVWQGCTSSGLNWNQTGYNDAEANLTSQSVGVGAGGYWMMAGPGREPGGYTTSGTSATSWGTAQAQSAVSDASQTLGFPYIFMDIEAAVPHGWNAGWAGVCSSTRTASSIPAALDWDTFKAFRNYVNGTTALFAAVYEAGDGGPNSWDSIFGSSLTLSNTLEWTYVNETSSISTFPAGWSVNGTVPVWFASALSNCQMMWQWSGGNGQLNGVGDFDQIDGNRNRLCK